MRGTRFHCFPSVGLTFVLLAVCFLHKAVTGASSVLVNVAWTVAPAQTPAAKNSVRSLSLNPLAFIKEKTLPLCPAHHLKKRLKLKDIHLLTQERNTGHLPT